MAADRDLQVETVRQALLYFRLHLSTWRDEAQTSDTSRAFVQLSESTIAMLEAILETVERTGVTVPEATETLGYTAAMAQLRQTMITLWRGPKDV